MLNVCLYASIELNLVKIPFKILVPFSPDGTDIQRPRTEPNTKWRVEQQHAHTHKRTLGMAEIGELRIKTKNIGAHGST